MTARAIVFDLDDTLYRERRFAVSGYRAVALGVEREFGIDREVAFRALVLSLRRDRRARAFQDLAASHGLPESVVPGWIECYRRHAPHLRLLPRVRRTLDDLRRRWRLGVLTNGLTGVQAAKVEALGLGPLVDQVIYADRFGGGKPSPEAFLEMLARLDVAPGRTVFAGDDPLRDIAGARRVGMKTVYLDRGRGGPAVGADAVVRAVWDVPAAAERLVGEDSGHVH
jgi:putative hydrolase of the HAD superfamily